MTRSLLINYSGYPAVMRSLALDNGLANLAGSLIDKGHETTILDYATVDTIKRLFPHEYSDQLSYLTRKIICSLELGFPPQKSDLKDFQELDRQINELQKKKVQQIAREISQYAKAHKVDFVGLKLWSGDGFEGSITIAEKLKQDNPGLPIFAGGPHVDSFKENIFDVCNIFDALVYGEGEETITMLADYVSGKRRLEDIPNLIYKNNGRIISTPIRRIKNLDSLTFPVYDEDVYLAMKGNQKIKMVFIDESRGCPNHCSYCIHPIKSGNRWRERTPEAVVKQMEQMNRKYGFTTFRFAGSNPPPFLKRRIANEILNRGLKVTYSAFGHIKDGLIVDFRLLRKSGCYSLFFGIESGSQKILDQSMNKGVKIDEITETIDACKRAGLYVVGSVIIPAPHETEETKKESFDLLLRMRPDSVVVWFPALMLGTDWEKNSQKYGFDIPDHKSYLKEAMVYKIKSFYPPSLWGSSSEYNLNGKSFKEITKETGNFICLLEKSKILTQVTSETALIAKYATMSPRDFRDKARKYLFSGDHRSIEELVSKINQEIMKGSSCLV
ncbi:radical SAM protein [bacterium]|nr:radical SAM protein [bacterium]NIN92011.1 radical SAM protein [bacterium]NIO18227.1 radical SAM protein [bacterium]NIO73201.1 radical SAM protein [bacterium]